MSHNLPIPRNDSDDDDSIQNNMVNLRKIEENHILLFAKHMYEVSSCMHFVSLIIPSNHVQDLKQWDHVLHRNTQYISCKCITQRTLHAMCDIPSGVLLEGRHRVGVGLPRREYHTWHAMRLRTSCLRVMYLHEMHCVLRGKNQDLNEH